MLRRYYGAPKDAKINDLMDRFPILFQDRNKSMDKTCMCWGIECPHGWYNILEQLCTVLEFHNMEFVKNYGIAIVADQVKEKFGTLRFYYTIREVDDKGVVLNDCRVLPPDKDNQLRIAKDYLDLLAENYIDEATVMSENTCANCGLPLEKDNKVVTKGWITFLCKRCDDIKSGKDIFDEGESEVEK